MRGVPANDKELAMKSDKTLRTSTFFATARLASVLAAGVLLFAGAANADPRPGNPGNKPWKPSWQEVRENNLLRSGIKVGSVPSHTNPRMSPATLKVPCAVCSYRPSMLVRR